MNNFEYFKVILETNEGAYKVALMFLAIDFYLLGFKSITLKPKNDSLYLYEGVDCSLNFKKLKILTIHENYSLMKRDIYTLPLVDLGEGRFWLEFDQGQNQLKLELD